MRKLSLTAIALYMSIVAAFAQAGTDSSAYKSKKLTVDEVNFVSGYYHQDGNNSAVTGGIGTEKLDDFANTIELKLTKRGSGALQHHFNLEMGIDHYTSASSDKIDPYTVSSPSYSDTRYYPSLGWSVRNEKTKTTFGANASYSTEFDYKSYGIGASFAKASKDNNREFSARLQAYFDTWAVIYPIELRAANPGTGNSRSGIQSYSPRNSYSLALSFAQVVNKELQILLVAEPTYQQGLLATKYQRVYFADGSEKAETLPDTRLKIPLGIRANYFLGDRFILRAFYRYYQDNWGLMAHTAELEVPIKLSPFFSVSPFYRFYAQNGVDYFAAYGQHASGDTYYTSDYDLSKFTSQSFGANLRITPEKGVFGLHNFHSAELRYGHYLRSNGLTSDQITLHLQFR